MIKPGSIKSFSAQKYEERLRGDSEDKKEDKKEDGGKGQEEEEDFDKLVASLDRGGPGMTGVNTPNKTL